MISITTTCRYSRRRGEALPSCGWQISVFRLSLPLCHAQSLMCLKWAEVSWEQTIPCRASLLGVNIMLLSVRHTQFHQRCLSDLLCRWCVKDTSQRTHSFSCWSWEAEKDIGRLLMGVKCCISLEKSDRAECAVLCLAAVVYHSYPSLYRLR